MVMPRAMTATHIGYLIACLIMLLAIYALTPTCRVGETACEAHKWMSITSVAVKIPAGAHPMAKFTFTMTGTNQNPNKETTTFVDLASYDQPRWSGTSTCPHPTGPIPCTKHTNLIHTGTLSVTMTGASFGDLQYSQRARAFSGAEAASWSSDSTLAMKSTHGSMRPAIDLVLSAGKRVTLSKALSFWNALGVSSSLRTNAPSTAGVSITMAAAMATTGSSNDVGGAGFNIADFSASIRVGFSRCEALRWKSDSSLECKTPAGRKTSRSMVGTVMVGARYHSTLSRSFSYPSPVVTTVKTSNAPLTGGTYFTVGGVSFGDQEPSGSGAIGGTTCEKKNWISESSMRCKAGSGWSFSKPVSMSVLQRISSVSLAASYSESGRLVTPLKTSTNAPPTGATSVTLQGYWFGPLDRTIKASKIGGSSAMAVKWQSESTLLLKAAPGADIELPFTLSMNKNIKTVSKAMSYDNSPVSRKAETHANAPPTGATSVTLSGNLGAQWDPTHRLRQGKTHSEGGVWLSQSSIRAKSPKGQRTGLRMQATVGMQSGTITRALSYTEMPFPRAVRWSANIPTTGAQSLTLSGVSFNNFDGTQRMNLASAPEASRWVADTAMVSKGAAGYGARRRVTVTAQLDGIGSLTRAFSYPFDPVLTSINTQNGLATGAHVSTVTGRYFNAGGTSARGRVGGTNLEMCAWVSDTSLRQKVPFGRGVAKAMSLTIALGRRTMSMALTFPNAGSAMGLMMQNGVPTGAQSFTVTGVEFGVVDDSAHRVRLGGTGSSAITWTGDTSIRGKVGRGAYRGGGITASALRKISSVTLMFSYNNVVSVGLPNPRQSNSPTTGTAMITLRGQYLINDNPTVAVRVGGSTVELQRWTSDSAVRCKATAGRGIKLSAGITVAGNKATASRSFSYAPTMTSKIVVGVNGPVTGAKSLTVLSADLGTTNPTVATRVGGSAMEAALWTADTTLRGKVPSGVDKQRLALATMLSLKGTLTRAYSYTRNPVPQQLTGLTNSAPTGSVSLTIAGAKNGYLDVSSCARVGGTACQANRWMGETSAWCKVPVGMGANRDVALSLKGYSFSSLTKSYSYSTGPVSQSISLTNSPTTGARMMVVTAKLMGPIDPTTSARIGPTTSEMRKWIADSSARLKAPGGSGYLKGVALTVASVRSTVSRSFSYAAKLSVTTVTRTNAASTGGTSMTVHGSSLGVNDYTGGIHIGGSSCEAVVWISETTAMCKVPAGKNSGSARLTMEVARRGTLSAAFTWTTVTTPTSVVRTNSPTTGGVSMTVFGRGLGSLDPTVRHRLGGTAFESQIWLSESGVRCRVPAGRSQRRTVAATLGLARGTLTMAMSYINVDSPMLKTGKIRNSPPTGSVTFSLTGTSFGTTQPTAGVRVGGSTTEAARWRADTALTAKNAAGITLRGNYAVSVRRNRDVGSLTQAFTFSGTPVFSSLVGSNAAVTGGNLVTILGSGFSMLPASEKSRIGGSVAEASIWVSDSSSRAKVAAGNRLSKPISVSVQLNKKSVTLALSYPAFAHIERDTPYNDPPSGATSITLSGIYFGSFDESGKALIGWTAMEAMAWKSHTSLVMKSPIGALGGKSVALTMGADTRTLSRVLSYNVINKESIVGRSNTAATGGTYITIQGAAFLSWDTTTGNRLGRTAVELARWRSETSVIAKVPMGHFGSSRSSAAYGKSVVLTMLRVSRVTTSMAFSYSDTLRITAATAGTNVPTTGSTTLSLIGVDFGTTDYSVKGSDYMAPPVTAMGSACEGAGWISDTLIRGRVSGGFGAMRGMQMSMLQRLAPISNVYSFDMTKPSDVVQTNAPSSGSLSITLRGTDLTTLASNTARVGGSTCGASEWTSDSSMRCKVSSGKLRGSPAITAALAIGTAPRMVTFNRVVLSSTTTVNLPNTGTVSITLSGSDDGLWDTSTRADIGGTVAEAGLWLSDTSMVAKSHQSAADVPMFLCISVQGQPSSITRAFTFNGIQLQAIINENGPPTGSVSITIRGENLVPGGDMSVKISIGFTAAATSVWVSDTSLAAKIAGGQKPLRDVAVSVINRKLTTSRIFTYNGDIATGITGRSNAAASGTTSLTVFGFGHASFDSTTYVTLGGTPCQSALWKSETSMRCRTIAGVGRQKRVSSTVLIISGTSTLAFTYDTNVLSSAMRRNNPGTGANSLTLTGGSFFERAITQRSRIGLTAGEATQFTSDTAMRIKMATGSQKSNRGLVSIAANVNAALDPTTEYDEPDGVGLIRSNAPGTGSAVVTLMGEHFTAYVNTVCGRMQFTASERSQWLSGSNMNLKVPRGLLQAGTVAVSADVRKGSFTRAISFNRIFLADQLSLANTAPTGSTSLTLSGEDFGMQNFCPLGRLGGTFSESSRWTSESSCTIKKSTGTGVRRIAMLSARGELATMTNVFTYNVPSVSSGVGANRPITGSSSVTLTGMGFLHSDGSSAARIGDSACEVSRWVGDSSIKAKAARAVNEARNNKMTLGNRISTQTMLYSFNGNWLTGRLGRTNLPMSGSLSLTTIGAGFAPSDSSPRERVGGTGCASMRWFADTAIRCKASSRVTTRGNTVASVAVQRGTGSNYFTYDPAAMSSAAYYNSPITGSLSMTMYGRFLAEADSTLSVRFGGTRSSMARWRSESEVRCKSVEGNGRGLTVTVSVERMLGTNTMTVTTDAPTVSTTVKTNLPVSGAASLTIAGAGFGKVPYSLSLSLGGTRCMAIGWTSETSVRCKSASAGLLDPAARVRATVAMQTSQTTEEMTQGVSYDNILASTIIRSNCPATGGVSVTVTGDNIGSTSVTSGGRAGSSSCEAMRWASASTVRCKVGSGMGDVGLCLAISSPNGKGSTVSRAFSVGVNVLSPIRGGSNSVASGATSVTIAGLNFDTEDSCIGARVASTGLQATTWSATTSLRGKLTAEMDTRPGRAAASVGDRIGTVSQAFTFDQARIGRFVSVPLCVAVFCAFLQIAVASDPGGSNATFLPVPPLGTDLDIVATASRTHGGPRAESSHDITVGMYYRLEQGWIMVFHIHSVLLEGDKAVAFVDGKMVGGPFPHDYGGEVLVQAQFMESSDGWHSFGIAVLDGQDRKHWAWSSCVINKAEGRMADLYCADNEPEPDDIPEKMEFAIDDVKPVADDSAFGDHTEGDAPLQLLVSASERYRRREGVSVAIQHQFDNIDHESLQNISEDSCRMEYLVDSHPILTRPFRNPGAFEMEHGIFKGGHGEYVITVIAGCLTDDGHTIRTLASGNSTVFMHAGGPPETHRRFQQFHMSMMAARRQRGHILSTLQTLNVSATNDNGVWSIKHAGLGPVASNCSGGFAKVDAHVDEICTLQLVLDQPQAPLSLAEHPNRPITHSSADGFLVSDDILMTGAPPPSQQQQQQQSHQHCRRAVLRVNDGAGKLLAYGGVVIGPTGCVPVQESIAASIFANLSTVFIEPELEIPVLGVTTFSGADDTLRCLRSIDWPVKDLVVVHGGTRDPEVISALLLLSFERPSLRALVFGGNIGTGAQWNQIYYDLVSNADYEASKWAIVSNHDIKFQRGDLEIMARTMRKELDENPVFGVGLFPYAWTDPEGNDKHWSVYSISRKAIETVGFIDENFWPAGGEDFDYEARLHTARLEFVVLNDAGTRLIHGPENVTGFVSSHHFDHDTPIGMWFFKGYQMVRRYHRMKWADYAAYEAPFSVTDDKVPVNFWCVDAELRRCHREWKPPMEHDCNYRLFETVSIDEILEDPQKHCAQIDA